MNKFIVLMLVLVLGFGNITAYAQGQQDLEERCTSTDQDDGREYDDFFLTAFFQRFISVVADRIGNIGCYLGLIFGYDSPIANVFDWAQNLFKQVDRILQTLGQIWSVVVQFTKPVIDFVIYAIENANRVIELLSRLFLLLLSVSGLMFFWLFQLSGVMFGIFAEFQGAELQPIPGMPRCITSPADSEICAVWYILDYTIFAPGTPGEYLIAIGVLAVDLMILFFIFKWLMNQISYFVSIFRGA
jgi:hypothetical protein